MITDRFVAALTLVAAAGVAGVAFAGEPTAPTSAPSPRAPPPRLEDRRDVDGRPYLLLGSGARRSGGEAVYSIALYVDETGARRAFPALASRAGGRGHEKLVGGDKAPTFVVWGDFGKLALLRLERDATAAEIRALFDEGTAGLRGDRAGEDARERVRGFLALFDRDLKRGDVIELHTAPSGALAVRFGDERRAAGPDARLCRALWEIWLGGRPISTELRRALVDRIDQLGR
jgi:hypothetical protein